MILHVYCNIERNHRILRHKSNSFGPKSSRNNLCVATCPSICIITRSRVWRENILHLEGKNATRSLAESWLEYIEPIDKRTTENTRRLSSRRQAKFLIYEQHLKFIYFNAVISHLLTDQRV